ncbi:hypothetical protein P175DRAFT_0461810 [Aspergillus ochraceoroseus IBT 24754]|uniref:Eisosome protein n=2 Tax=Aspergillus subgen. Nidulantes TaxID=2720870 RepID=A0A0F8VPL1_9EURO|nr:uncharacterized protein P175DRAFT_0461810 [Aspergillus ochraceoroseus IBT 24754]KKK25121.1 hypothetical protein ARAM_003473 [Aspergillus rambellii]PTU19243.1 hypothetical protein P175DRAFT_0461810 [Aspergillus ochraceoroseus IBT 24754]
MATVEQQPAVEQRIPRSRSARLADQAATAALYVTHPERSLSLREPATAEPSLETLKETGSRPGFSHASALAALAHARKRELGSKQTASEVQAAEVPSYEGYQAAICALRDYRTATVPPPVSTSPKQDIGTGQTLEARSEVSQRARAVSAASGAYYGSRMRADSAPSQVARTGLGVAAGAGDPFADLDKYMNASRIQNMAQANAKLYTATPPVPLEVKEHRRKSILEAAAMSMARDMYGTMEAKEGGSAGIAAAQRGHARARSQRSVPKPDAALVQQVVSIQDIAQKRAAEKIASLEDETAIYREYYGIEPQPTRSTLSTRKRRGSNETETSTFDMERSKEIRTQMSTLRSKLNAVDEQREKDRDNLLQVARKNVDAALRDMEMRVYAETGRAPLSMQKDLEETAMLRALQGKKEIDAQYPMTDKINIGSQKYVDMDDVEALARARLQPTFNEIADLADAQRAKDLEDRLDEERRQRLEQTELEREADIRMEEKRHKMFLKQDMKSKEEKVWLWRRKSKKAPAYEPAFPKDVKGHEVNGVTRPSESAAQDAGQYETAEGDHVVASGAVPEEPQLEPATRQESKFRSWFSKLRRGSTNEAEVSKEVNGTHAEEEGAQEAIAADTSAAAAAAATAEGAAEEAGEDEQAAVEEGVHEANEPEGVREQIATTVGGVAGAAEGNQRATALRSHPVKSTEPSTAQNGSSAEDSENKLDGMTPSEYLATHQDSKDIVEHSSEMKQNRLKTHLKKIVSRSLPEAKSSGVMADGDDAQEATEAPGEATYTHEMPSSSPDREALRESAIDQGLEAPPVIEDTISKRLSNGTGRESRFSEDL